MGRPMSNREHWQAVYEQKTDAELSWFQASPAVALELVDSLSPRPARVIDVGGGQSLLAGELLARGVGQVTVLDIAQAAIDRGRARLSEHGAPDARIDWRVGDVLAARDLSNYDWWHDRAVFHFLTEGADRARYVAVATAAVRAGGHLMVATFGPRGPDKCSGLPVRRYDAAELAQEFGAAFKLVAQREETHTTPWGKPQEFAYAVLRRC